MGEEQGHEGGPAMETLEAGDAEGDSLMESVGGLGKNEGTVRFVFG